MGQSPFVVNREGLSLDAQLGEKDSLPILFTVHCLSNLITLFDRYVYCQSSVWLGLV